MLYLLALTLAILAGVVRSRQINALMLWELRAVFLLPLALFSALMPYWLSTYRPGMIWTEDRKLLIALQLISRSLYLVFVLYNLVFTARRTTWATFLLRIQVSYHQLVQQLDRHPHRIPARPAQTGRQFRDLSPLRLLGLVLAVPALVARCWSWGPTRATGLCRRAISSESRTPCLPQAFGTVLCAWHAWPMKIPAGPGSAVRFPCHFNPIKSRSP